MRSSFRTLQVIEKCHLPQRCSHLNISSRFIRMSDIVQAEELQSGAELLPQKQCCKIHRWSVWREQLPSNYHLCNFEHGAENRKPWLWFWKLSSCCRWKFGPFTWPCLSACSLRWLKVFGKSHWEKDSIERKKV